MIVIALDFSKAFDTVRHSSLLKKFAKLDLPDNVYNWLVDYHEDHSHCASYQGETSKLLHISGSIIQSSGVGPAAYIVTASDLQAITPGNLLCKYADDSYLIVPSSNADTRSAELSNVEAWARRNNLKLNQTKSVEVILTSRKRRQQALPPAPHPGIGRVSSVKILGVTISSSLSVSQHVTNVVNSCAQTTYALRTLRAHGMSDSTLKMVYRSEIVAKLLYAGTFSAAT